MASKQEMELMTVTIMYFNYQFCTRASNPSVLSIAFQTFLDPGGPPPQLTKVKGYLPLFPTPPAPSITSLYSLESAAGLLQLLPTGRAPDSIVLLGSPGALGKAS